MPNVAELITERVTLTVDCVDRLYLNAYVPRFQTEGGVMAFLRARGHAIPSPALFAQLTTDFKARLRAWVQREHIPWVEFQKRERKDDVVQRYRDRFPGRHGVVCVGVAQEKARAWTATKDVRGRHVHFTYRWKTVCVNHDSLYVVDREWGPGFLKVCGYVPYTMKLCLNGYEWAKRQLTRRRIPFAPLDNGFQACARPAVLQAVFDRWFPRLPLPLTVADQAAGFGYQLSLLQMEVSRTQVFDRPLCGREFFEEVLRDQLDLGRPDRVQLLFDRKITRATPGRFRTRVITAGVVPSLHVEDTRCHIKQSCKEGRALRTETTLNDTYDFGVGRGLRYLRLPPDPRAAHQHPPAPGRAGGP